MWALEKCWQTEQRVICGRKEKARLKYGLVASPRSATYYSCGQGTSVSCGLIYKMGIIIQFIIPGFLWGLKKTRRCTANIDFFDYFLWIFWSFLRCLWDCLHFIVCLHIQLCSLEGALLIGADTFSKRAQEMKYYMEINIEPSRARKSLSK